FFVLGLSLRREHFFFLDKLWVRLCSVVILGVTAFLAIPISDHLSRDWLFWRDSLTDRDIDPLMPSIGIRLAFMGLALVMTIAVLALTPKRRTWYTDLGAYTLFVYLGHSVVLILLKASPWYTDLASSTVFLSLAYSVVLILPEAAPSYAFLKGTGPIGLGLTLVLALALIFLLYTPWARKSMRWLVEPNFTWLLRQDAQDTQGGQSGQSSRTDPART